MSKEVSLCLHRMNPCTKCKGEEIPTRKCNFPFLFAFSVALLRVVRIERRRSLRSISLQRFSSLRCINISAFSSDISCPKTIMSRDDYDALVRNGVVKTGTFTLKSGHTSPIYIDFRHVQSLPGLNVSCLVSV